MDVTDIKDVYDWLAYGVERGYCSEAVCNTHDGLPLVDDEIDEFEDGGDPCIPATRLYHPD